VAVQRQCTPVRLSCSARSCQFGRANAPMMPQEVQTVRGSKAGTGVASSKRVHTHQGIVMAKLASHRKRAHAVFAHAGSVIGGPR